MNAESLNVIGRKLVSFLKVDVTWKVIVLGFYHKINDKQYLQR